RRRGGGSDVVRGFGGLVQGNGGVVGPVGGGCCRSGRGGEDIRHGQRRGAGRIRLRRRRRRAAADGSPPAGGGHLGAEVLQREPRRRRLRLARIERGNRDPGLLVPGAPQEGRFGAPFFLR